MNEAIFQGQAVRVSVSEHIAELCFDLQGDSVNKFNALTLKELREAVDKIKSAKGLQGLIATSAKDVFIVGADVTEFLEHFKKSEAELAQWLLGVDRIFSDIEDLPYPTVTAINGFALGGGMEFALSTTYRVMAANTKVGLPETKLGIYPGWGGTVRLSRLAGADNAIEWIAGGEQWGADAALKIGAVDAVTAPEKLREAALQMIQDANHGKLNWKARVQEKTSPLKLNQIEATMVFEGSKGFVAGKAGPNYPSPVAAIEAMQKGALKSRDEALAIEAAGFAKIAKTPTAAALVSIFLGDQYLKKNAKKIAKAAKPVQTAAVLGAGIMGGGIGFTSASKKIPIFMKDIAPKALDLGLAEAAKILEKQVARGKMSTMQMAETLGRIHATLSYGDFKSVDIVVEAVVENEKIKKQVLSELEASVRENTIITSNTSTISITRLAEALKRPENFCGMHFFNPVPRMPLVEVIRGKKSSGEAVATTVAYATAMGKTSIVVNDCAGFFINRVLFPYLAGFNQLINDGVDYLRIDKVMEKFGWPMGPAYLLDVVGIDTGHHADSVMAAEYPDRMSHSVKTAIDLMYENKRFGQKNGIGFYKYTPDKKGPPKKEIDPATADLLRGIASRSLNAEITDQQIIDRMMLPMIIECSRCLEDEIVESPIDIDLGLIYGLGFPPFRGGALRYADHVGVKNLVQAAGRYRELGKLYEPTQQMRALAESGKSFY